MQKFSLRSQFLDQIIQSIVTCIIVCSCIHASATALSLSFLVPGINSRLSGNPITFSFCRHVRTAWPPSLYPPQGSMPHCDPSQAACPWIKGENYTEMSLKTCSSTPPQSQPSVIFYLALFGTVAPSLFHLSFLVSPRAVFATPHWVHLNVCHLWLCFTPVVLLEVGVSRLNSCHVPEEAQKMFTSAPLPTPASDCKLGGFFKDTRNSIHIHAWWSNVNDYP